MSAEMAAETVVDVVEEALDTVVRVNVIKQFFGQKHTQIGITAVVAVGLGLVTGYKIAEKRLQARYDVLLEEELEKSREFLYEQGARINKEGDFEDPEKMLAQIAEEVSAAEARTDAVPTEVGNMKVDYSKMFTGADPNPEPDTENEFLQPKEEVTAEVTDDIVVVEKKLFEGIAVEDMDAHDAATQMLIEANLPHVISAEDFNENETEYEQVTITWFAGDDVLVDETEQMIDDVEGVVGVSNMDRFGYLSGDNNIVYIRNTDKELEFEVVRSEGNYAQEVLGFMHSDETFERRPRRIRRGDDG